MKKYHVQLARRVDEYLTLDIVAPSERMARKMAREAAPEHDFCDSLPGIVRVERVSLLEDEASGDARVIGEDADDNT